MKAARVLGAVLALIVPQAGMACPDLGREAAAAADFDGSPLEVALIASGDGNGAYCKILPENAPGVLGFFNAAPDLTLRPVGAAAMPLEFSVQSDCDSTLLIGAGSDRWYFDDDAGEGETPFIRVSETLQGPYKIWVGGFFEPTDCDAVLRISVVD